MQIDNKYHRLKKYGVDVILAFLVLTTPFLIYAHLFFKKTNSISVVIFNHEFKNSFADDQTFVWIFLKALIPLTLFLIWFFTSSKKWKYTLLPFLFIFFQSICIFLKLLFFEEEGIRFLPVFRMFLVFCGLIYLVDSFIFRFYRERKLRVSLKELLYTNYKSSYNAVQTTLNSLEGASQKKNTAKGLREMYHIWDRLKALIATDNLNVFHIEIKSKTSVNLFFGSLLIAIFPLAFLDKLVPEGAQSLNLFFFDLQSNGFADVNMLVWYLSTKVIVIIPFIIWFVSSPYWWRYSILSPIVLYTFQFWEAFQENIDLESYGNLRAVPGILVIVILVFLLSRAVRYRIKLVEIYEYLTAEVEAIFQKLGSGSHVVSSSKKKYQMLRSEMLQSENTLENLRSLSDFKKELEDELK